MSTVQRPNKDALAKACDIYRDAMRPFLVRVLRRVKGSNLQYTIRYSLPDGQRRFFDIGLTQYRDVAGAIDIGMFPHLIRAHWRDCFFHEFRRDNSVLDRVWLVRDARNRVSHPGTIDLDDEDTRSRMSDIAYVLGSINAPEEKKAVESIRDSRWGSFSPPQFPEQPRASTTVVSSKTEQSAASNRPVIRPNRQINDDLPSHPTTAATEELQMYVIKVDDPTNRSRIHRIDCRWYADRKEETLSDNYWLHGPYVLDMATRTEQEVGKRDSGPCGTCMR